MKNLTTVFLGVILVLGAISCQERNDIQLIRANDNGEYMFLHKQFNKGNRQQLGIFDFDNEQIKMASDVIDGIKDRLKKLNNKNEQSFKPINFNYTLYINGKGKIEKIVSLSSISKKIDDYVASKLKNWEMNIFSSDNPTKYAINWEFSLFKPKGEENFSLLSSSLPVGEKIAEDIAETYFIQVEKMPSPIGGIKAIQEKIHYPEIAKRAGIEGRVFVKAYIDEKGNVANAEIIKGLDGGCNEEALKAVKETKFIPGRQRGKPVKVQVSIPILFKLDSKKEDDNTI